MSTPTALQRFPAWLVEPLLVPPAGATRLLPKLIGHQLLVLTRRR